MIRINLLPHREVRRERRKKDFVAAVVATVIAGAVLSGMVALGISGRIDAQQARNDFIKRENEKLDAQVNEIAQLREEIDSLKARKLAVENLQRDRTLPVHVLVELVKHSPEGMYFRQMRQNDRKLTLAGMAQSNERVSELLKSLGNDTPWLERPELVEIKAVRPGKPDSRGKAGDDRRLFEFSMNASIKAAGRPDETPAAADPGKASASGAKPSGVQVRPLTEGPVNMASR